MSRPARAFTALMLLALFSGCSPQAQIEQFTNDEEQKRAIDLIEMMRDGKAEELAPMFQSSLQSPELIPTLEQMATMTPPGPPKERTLVGAHVNFANGVRSSNLTYQYDFGDRWFMINCAYVDSGTNKGIFGMQVVQLKAKLQAQPEFSLHGKSGMHYAVLIGAVVSLIPTVVAFVTAILEKGLKKKWLWVLFTLVGVAQFSIDWATGATEFKYWSILLFSASAVAPPYGSWVLSVALPIGAVVYLGRRIWNHPRPHVSKAGNP